MNKKKCLRLLSLLFDAAIILCVVLSLVLMLNDDPSVKNKGTYFKYFTVLSNCLLGVVAVPSLLSNLLSLCGLEAKNFSKISRICMIIASTFTTITMLVVVSFLGPTQGYPFMYYKYNLLMHLISPLLGLVRVMLFEADENKLSWKWCLLTLLPLGIYGIGYVSYAIANNGLGKLRYDFYGFGTWGVFPMILIFIGITAIDLGFCFATYFLQKKIGKAING